MHGSRRRPRVLSRAGRPRRGSVAGDARLEMTAAPRSFVPELRDRGRPLLILLLLQLLLLSGPALAFLRPNETECPTEALVDLSVASPKPGFAVEWQGVFYPADAIYWVDGRPMGCPCRTQGCLPLCCTKGVCPEPLNLTAEEFHPFFDPKTMLIRRDIGPRNMWQFAWDPCDGGDRYILEPESQAHVSRNDKFYLLSNGSVYQPTLEFMRNYTDFCIRWSKNAYRVVLCFDEPGQEPIDDPYVPTQPMYPLGMLVSVLFLALTIIVYLLLPDLRNLPGKTLCAYVLCLISAYSNLVILQWMNIDLGSAICLIMAYIVHFSFLASFFWLNVMCFDIWWTFGGFRSLHGSVKQRERKKFIFYSIYAWGFASLLTGICMIMDLVPGIPQGIVRPEFGVGSCWFHTNEAKAIYFYGPMGMTVLCNICLFIITAVKISSHKKDTARQLKGSESKRHDDNKQWFNLYLKLFIVMGINWSMEIVSWLMEDSLKSVWFITDLTNTLQGVIIFIIFVWKDKIKRLLFKRFGCKGGKWLSRASTTRNGCTSNSMASRNTCVTATQLQEKPSFAPDASGRTGKVNLGTDTESDCV